MSQYSQRHPDHDWFFREFVAALTDRELRAVQLWNLQRRADDPTCADDATAKLAVIDECLHRRWRRRFIQTKRPGRW